MSKTGIAKGIMSRLAGDQMTGYFKEAFDTAGKIGKAATQGALNYGAGIIAPGATTNQIPKLLRAGANSPLPKLGYYGGQAALAGGIAAAVNSFDQQSNHSQPMSGGTGNSEMDKFVMSQKLQNQKFMHDMALVQARAESRIPGAQYPGSLMNMTQKSDVLRDAAEAERLYTDAGEITNREVQGIGRMIYGTGLRA